VHHAVPIRALQGEPDANPFGLCRCTPLSLTPFVSADHFQPPHLHMPRSLKSRVFNKPFEIGIIPFGFCTYKKGGGACPPVFWRAIFLLQKRAYGPFFGPSLACPSASTLMRFQPLCSHGITHSGARGLPAGILEGDIVTLHQNPDFSFLASFLATRHWAKKTLWPPVPSKGVGTGQVWTYNLVRLRAMVPRKVSP
jgi:hypothetical protein